MQSSAQNTHKNPILAPQKALAIHSKTRLIVNIEPYDTMKRPYTRFAFLIYVLCLIGFLSTGCTATHLSDAARSYAYEYWHEAYASYRKVYAKTDRKDKAKREQIRARMESCRAHINSPQKPNLPADSASSCYRISLVKGTESPRNNWAPMIFNDHQLLFASDRKQTYGTAKSKQTGQKFADLFSAIIATPDSIAKPIHLSNAINSNAGEEHCAVHPKGTCMVVTRRSERKGVHYELLLTEKRNNTWSIPQTIPLSNVANPKHACFSRCGKWLYFAAQSRADNDKSANGMGGSDLYRIAFPIEHNSIPENLGDLINTPFDEAYPSFRNDTTLCFTSNGHAGFGGKDIFQSILRDQVPVRVEHLPAPVNSTADDYAIAFLSNGKQGIFASSREHPKGYSSLFAFEHVPPSHQLQGTVSFISGSIPANYRIKLVSRSGETVERTLHDATFSLPLQPEEQYLIAVYAEGYRSDFTEFSTSSKHADTYIFNAKLHLLVPQVNE